MTKAAKPASASMAMRKAQKAALVRRYAGEATSKSAAKGGSKNSPAPLVGVIMGSVSDWPTMQKAADLLSQFAVPFESRIVSAHRTPERLFSYARDAQKRGLKVIIAGAGGAAHLPGMTAAMTTLPVIGVPVQSKALSGLDSLLSIVQMPPGIPVATVAIGEAGAANAALLAMSILALSDEELGRRLAQWRMAQTEGVPETPQAE